MTGRLAGKIAIITGGASGMGYATAELFKKEGAVVTIADITERGVDAGKTLGVDFVKVNMANSQEVDALVKSVVDKHGHVDIMVNAAGVAPSMRSVLDLSDDEWNRVISINLTGVFYGVRAAVRSMRETNTKGSVINISSIAGIIAMPSGGEYCASKGGVIQLTKGAAVDCAPYGIRVNAICPGVTNTPMLSTIMEKIPQEGAVDTMKSLIPLKRFAEAKEQANVMLFLASEEASYVTGAAFVVDGGTSII